MEMTNMPDLIPLAPDDPDTSPAAPKRVNRMRLAQWMIFLSLALMFVPILLLGQILTERIDTLETEMATMEAVVAVPPVDPTTAALDAELTAARTLEGSLREFATQLNAANVSWPLVLYTVGSYDPDHIQLTAFSQLQGGALSLQGYAREEADVILYERQLEDTGVFSAVDIRAVQREPVAADDSGRFPIFFHMQLRLPEGDGE